MVNPSVQITDTPHLPKAETCTSIDVGGVYHTRNLSRVSHERWGEQRHDAEDGEDWRRDDGRKKQVFKGTTLLWYGFFASHGRYLSEQC
jgi:KUP system potassium uptake protein